MVSVKDYECSEDDLCLPRDPLRLWLYVELTEGCPAACPFCVGPSKRGKGPRSLDPRRLRRVLEAVAPRVAGVSLTGGEPMADIPLLEDTVGAIRETLPEEVPLDMVTNGVNIGSLPRLCGLERFYAIHVSRHAVEDGANAALMNWPGAPGARTLKDVFASLPDPGAAVLNCVLQKNGVRDLKTAGEYLEAAAEIGAANVSFIGMFLANEYCRENYVSPGSLDFSSDPRFTVWNRFHDHGFCSCLSGDYHAKAGYIRFYCRCPGNEPPPPYCRQLVYGPDDVLRQGFGSAPVLEV